MINDGETHNNNKYLQEDSEEYTRYHHFYVLFADAAWRETAGYF